MDKYTQEIQDILARYGLSKHQWAERVALARQQLIERNEIDDISAVLARHEMDRIRLELQHRAELEAFEGGEHGGNST